MERRVVCGAGCAVVLLSLAGTASAQPIESGQAFDLSVGLFHATVQVEQRLGDGSTTVGTGFLISDPTPDGRPRTVLVTANHVFKKMPGPVAMIGFRVENADGSWRYNPEPLQIRDGAKELWAHHPERDIAVIAVEAPPQIARAALPQTWLATDDTFTRYAVRPGDEMLALGFPEGFSSNAAGFPILRSGRVASFPLAPSSAFPTFLLDLNVFPGNSGGPIYVSDRSRQRPGAKRDLQFIAGMLTQEVERGSRSLGIAVVTDAKFIRETLGLLDHPDAQPSTPGAAKQAMVPAGVTVAEDAAYGR
jgi:S1-C subfamily serine protease